MVDAAWLKRQGIDPKSIHDYVQRGWLERVVRGVYRRPGAGQAPSATADWQLPLLSIQWIMEHDVHLGGLSALAWHGFSHYLPLGGEAQVYLYGTVPRSEEHTSELQSLMRISYAVICLKKKKQNK